MTLWIQSNESFLRIGTFVTIFGAMALAEILAPRRNQSAALRRSRWPSNLMLLVLDTLLVRVVLPAGALGIAALCVTNGIGFFNIVSAPAIVGVLISLLGLDFLIYVQHILFHRVPLFFRFHVIHHADVEFDATTGIRFHPVEMLLSMAFKGAAIALLGAPLLAVFLFEVVLNASAVFTHANWNLGRADRWLRFLVVTPDMHRIHHSTRGDEMTSNFGFNLPWWDRIFRTYREAPALPHETMNIGVCGIQQRNQTVSWMITTPFQQNLSSTPEEESDMDECLPSH
ncbi:MAG TPA: sterol desaturase family protein [Thermoanaerobaculia bacterium]|nr:sterol desaturase family protein [Thermoanaerobaculia bacterium]